MNTRGQSGLSSGNLGEWWSPTSDGAFSNRTRLFICERDGWLCCRCGTPRGLQIHHRLPRRMGGTSEPMVSHPDNGVLLCHVCHAWVERNRDQARSEGWLLDKVSDVGVVGVAPERTWRGGARLTDAKVDVHDKVGDPPVPSPGVADLSDGSALLVGDEVDKVALHLSDLREPFDRVGDVVEERDERSEDR